MWWVVLEEIRFVFVCSLPTLCQPNNTGSVIEKALGHIFGGKKHRLLLGLDDLWFDLDTKYSIP